MTGNVTEAKKQSDIINYLRATAILLVVIHHAMTYGESYLGGGDAAYWVFITLLRCIHVPLFFMISGYLCHAQGVRSYYKKKTLQILVPFLVFTSLKLAFNLLSDQFSHSDTVLGEVLTAYVFGEYYWFSYCLLLLSFLAPLLWKLKNKWALVGVFTLLLSLNVANGFLCLVDTGGPFQVFSVLIYGVWFLFGYVLRQINAGELLRKGWIKHGAALLSAVISAFVILLCLQGLFNVFLAKFILSLSLSYLLLYIFSSIRIRIPLLTYVSRYSYQIFLLDSFVKVILFAIVSKLTRINLPLILLLAAGNVMIGVLISCVVHRIKYVRTLLGLSR